MSHENAVEATIARVAEAVAAIPGVSGLALGGSRARGMASPDSDIDVAVYYRPETRPDFDSLLRVATTLDDNNAPKGFGRYGEWGPWINGGIWLRVDGTKTDILLRDITRVTGVLRDCVAGRIEVAYQPGHPHVFVSSIYAGEVFHNRTLVDQHSELARLKTYTDPYPPALAKATISKFGWEAGFALETAYSAADRGDVLYVSGCLFRAASCLVHVVFARNKRYLLNEKGALAATNDLPLKPVDFPSRVAGALTGFDPESLRKRLEILEEVRAELLG
jgi:predicted nucleotidyltransferase